MHQIGQGALVFLVVDFADLLHPTADAGMEEEGQMQCVWHGRRFAPFTDWVRLPSIPRIAARTGREAAKREECLVPSLSAELACPLFEAHCCTAEPDQGTELILLIPHLSPPPMLLFDIIMIITDAPMVCPHKNYRITGGVPTFGEKNPK